MGALGLLQEIRSLSSGALISLSKMYLFATALILIFGYPLIAALISSCGLSLFLIQKKSIMALLKDTKKWLLVACAAFLASVGSWLMIKVALNSDKKHVHQILQMLGFVSQELSGGLIVYFLYQDSQLEPEEEESAVQFLEVKIKILEGRSLVPKDKNIFGRPTSSDPYVKIYHATNYIAETGIMWKTLNPVWENADFTLPIVPKALTEFNTVELHIFDRDKFSSDDAMGTVFVPIPRNINMSVCTWYPVESGSGRNYCRNATGELKIEIELRPLLSKRFKRQLSHMSSVRSINPAAPSTKRVDKSKTNGNATSSANSFGKLADRTSRSTLSDNSSRKHR